MEDKIREALKWLVEEAWQDGYDTCYGDEHGVPSDDGSIEELKTLYVQKALEMIKEK